MSLKYKVNSPELGALGDRHRWLLPDGNGIDVADRAVKLRAKTIIISGYAFGLPAGAAERHGIITKPVATHDLVAAVQRTIGNPGT